MIRVLAEGALWFLGLAGVSLGIGFLGALLLERLQRRQDRKLLEELKRKP